MEKDGESVHNRDSKKLTEARGRALIYEKFIETERGCWNYEKFWICIALYA